MHTSMSIETTMYNQGHGSEGAPAKVTLWVRGLWPHQGDQAVELVPSSLATA